MTTKYRTPFWDSGLGFATFAVALILGCVAFISPIAWVIIETSFPADAAQIEQLRADSADVDPAQAEDVIGQVTQWNQKIVSNQAINRIPVVNLFVPDGWDRMALIAVPVTP